ncbi:hypothetical protein VNO77_02686 [Canavalia gladiata]|uniref:Uncharacterized protein n=1 Tax=Canavalia gladiata TaxID=3824 RepID=A0AAN9R652_CANGL
MLEAYLNHAQGGGNVLKRDPHSNPLLVWSAGSQNCTSGSTCKDLVGSSYVPCKGHAGSLQILVRLPWTFNSLPFGKSVFDLVSQAWSNSNNRLDLILTSLGLSSPMSFLSQQCSDVNIHYGEQGPKQRHGPRVIRVFTHCNSMYRPNCPDWNSKVINLHWVAIQRDSIELKRVKGKVQAAASPMYMYHNLELDPMARDAAYNPQDPGSSPSGISCGPQLPGRRFETLGSDFLLIIVSHMTSHKSIKPPSSEPQVTGHVIGERFSFNNREPHDEPQATIEQAASHWTCHPAASHHLASQISHLGTSQP